ncbi:unnamed protein product [Chondrus crispus]|uniref:SET domain-containing protein n=1 Tax=Chondrus crispus TaxID=2769 RepID=R7QRS4_CHOCR|nr:unnamed protein product [Chondrus crispus]CDF41197.1 unnamed protein product [Chondrus crispus]|eukprot:XP_005711491.1 unnamed protein product [Chondrus crispus]
MRGTEHLPCRPDVATAAKAAFAIQRLGKRCWVGKPGIPPPGVAWVRTQANVAVPEKYEHDFHVPYLGESDAMIDSSNTLAMDLFQQDLEEDGNDSEIEEFNYNIYAVNEGPSDIPKPPKQTGDTPKKELRSSSLRTEASPTEVAEKVVPTYMLKQAIPVWDRAAKRVALRDIMDRLGTENLESIKTVISDVFKLEGSHLVASYQANVLMRKKLWQMQYDEERGKKEMHVDVVKHARREMKTCPSDVLKSKSIPFFVCRQCYTYVCSLHGYQNDARPVKKPYDKSKKEVLGEEAAAEIEAKCEDHDSSKCWFGQLNEDDCVEWVSNLVANPSSWNDIHSVVRELFETFGHDPCRITSMLKAFIPQISSKVRFTCFRVGYLCRQFFSQTTGAMKAPPARTKKPQSKWTKSRSRRPAQEIESMQGGKRLDYVPCRHDGACTTKNCICMQSGLLCEKFCGCNHTHVQNRKLQYTCSNAFRGCACKAASACASKACFCFSMNRECDPDLCRQCHECRESPLPSGKNWSCTNEGLQMNEKQRIVVGHSKVHGWGAFAVRDIAKNEIIGEYVGELIKQEEAERRGRVYDEINYSFLFNTTQDYALDSTRMGNKLRYCNHSIRPNCEPKVMRVGGDVRVGLYAKRNIARNEELFFNYGYNDGPAWAMQGKGKHSAASKKKTAKRVSPSDAESEEILPVSSRKRKHLEEDNDDEHPILLSDAEEDYPRLAPPKITIPSRPRQRTMPRAAEVNRRHSVSGIAEARKLSEDSIVQRRSVNHSNTGEPAVMGRSLWRGVLRRVSGGAAKIVEANTAILSENDNCPLTSDKASVVAECQKQEDNISPFDAKKQERQNSSLASATRADEGIPANNAAPQKSYILKLAGSNECSEKEGNVVSSKGPLALNNHVKTVASTIAQEHADKRRKVATPDDFKDKRMDIDDGDDGKGEKRPVVSQHIAGVGRIAGQAEASLSHGPESFEAPNARASVPHLDSNWENNCNGTTPPSASEKEENIISKIGLPDNEPKILNSTSRKRTRPSDGKEGSYVGSSVACLFQTTLTAAKRQKLLGADKPTPSESHDYDHDIADHERSSKAPRMNGVLKLFTEGDRSPAAKLRTIGSNKEQSNTLGPKRLSQPHPQKQDGPSRPAGKKQAKENGALGSSEDDGTDEAVPVVNLVSDDDEVGARAGTNEHNFSNWFT